MKYKSKIIHLCIICVAVILCVVVAFFVYKSSTPKKSFVHQKCPEEYAENDAGIAEYEKVMVAWTLDYLKTHPEATMSDWAKAKTQLWTDNNCVVALQRLKLSGKVADMKPYELIDYDIQNAITAR
jgi:hypothetical protein